MSPTFDDFKPAREYYKRALCATADSRWCKKQRSDNGLGQGVSKWNVVWYPSTQARELANPVVAPRVRGGFMI
jgi:hypothetical protein